MSPIYRRDPLHESATLDGETILLDLADGQFYRLADTAARIWERLDGASDTDAIAREFAGRHDCTLAQCRSDIEAFCAHLAELGFAERVTPPS